jgi:GTP cyclohydrolase II
MEPLVIISSRGYSDENVLVRVHDQCLTSEVFGSERCDCRRQLKNSIDMINKEPSGGIVIYLQQEGRGIGLANKIAAYALQDTGLDTVEANLRLGLPPELREYSCVPDILRNLGINSIRLLTNNPYKVEQLQRLGVNITERVPILVPASTHSQPYMQTKQDKMHHILAPNLASLALTSAPETNDAQPQPAPRRLDMHNRYAKTIVEIDSTCELSTSGTRG